MTTTASSTPSLFDLYFDYVKDTEPPVIFHRWSLLSSLGAMLGRQVWIPFGSFRIFPNQYVMLIAEPGARKSTAIKTARKLLSKAGYDKFAAEKTSKEKFLLDLEGVEESSDTQVSEKLVMENLLGTVLGAEPRETYIVADEFNDFMRCGDLEFHSMLGALWDWDDESTAYKQRLKNSRSVSIFQPTINLLGGNTHTNFAEMFPPAAIGQGFISRLILVFSEPSGKKIAFPEPPSPEREQTLIRALQRIKSKMNGPMQLSGKAKEVLTVLYNTFDGLPDARLGSYSTRRYTHLMKLCILCAAARLSMAIELEDVVLANTILSYTEHFMPKALGEFGKAKNADVQQMILNYLTANVTKGPVGLSDLYGQVSSNLDRQEDLVRIMAGLQTAKKVQYIVNKNTPGGGGYLIVRKMISSQQLYVNMELLKEYEHAKI